MGTPCGLSSTARRHLLAALPERPWPPPPAEARSIAVLTTLERLLGEHADSPPAGASPGDDWIVVPPAGTAPAVRSGVIDRRVHVLEERELAALGAELRAEVERACPVARLCWAGGESREWAGLLPPGSDVAGWLSSVRSGAVHALRTDLAWPGFGTLISLHAWTVRDGEAVLEDRVSGVLRLLPPLTEGADT